MNCIIANLSASESHIVQAIETVNAQPIFLRLTPNIKIAFDTGEIEVTIIIGGFSLFVLFANEQLFITQEGAKGQKILYLTEPGVIHIQRAGISEVGEFELLIEHAPIGSLVAV